MSSERVVRYLFILYLLLLIGYILYNVYNERNGRLIHHEHPGEEELDSFVQKYRKKKKKRSPKKPQVASFQFEDSREVMVSNQKPDLSQKHINFEKIKEYVEQSWFVHQFYQALIKSYRCKLDRYVDIYHQMSSEKDNGNSGSSIFDISGIKSQKRKKEFSDIIRTLRTKIKKTRRSEIQESLPRVIHDREKGLSSLVGMEEIKDRVARKIYSFTQDPESFVNSYQTMVLYGPSGIGKTKLAHTISYIYSQCGILARYRTKETTASDFTTALVNESGSITRDVFTSSLEGVLFIDEAYSLTPSPGMGMMRGDQHNQDAIAELIKVMEDYRGLNIVIAAGYKEEMLNRFLKYDKGMERRFRDKIELNRYTPHQLSNILIGFLRHKSKNISIRPEDANIIYSIVRHFDRKEVFAKQAGDMEIIASNILEAKASSIQAWENGGQEQIIVSGFNDFLENKGYDTFIRGI